MLSPSPFIFRLRGYFHPSFQFLKGILAGTFKTICKISNDLVDSRSTKDSLKIKAIEILKQPGTA
jgi:hypothetical protein